MREYRYIAIFEKDGAQFQWKGRASNKAVFIKNTIEHITSIDKDCKFVSARKVMPEHSRPKKYYSFACVDMGQAFRD